MIRFIMILLCFPQYQTQCNADDLDFFRLTLHSHVYAPSDAEITVTLWYNHGIYQCLFTPSTPNFVQTCTASESFLYPDCDPDPTTKMLIQNNDDNAPIFDTIEIFTTTGFYGAQRFCGGSDVTGTFWPNLEEIPQSPLTTCSGDHPTQYSATCTDNDGDCFPINLLITFDTSISTIDTLVDNARLDDGSSLLPISGELCCIEDDICCDDEACCDDLSCIEEQCQCLIIGDSCTNNAECCHDPDNVICEAVDGSIGDFCCVPEGNEGCDGDDDACCGSLVCNVNTCEVCRNLNGDCNGNCDCCNSGSIACIDESCVPCLIAQDECDGVPAENTCCSGLFCGEVDGLGDHHCCVTAGDGCSGNDNDDCCGGLFCHDDVCDLCDGEDEPCEIDDDCCEDKMCHPHWFVCHPSAAGGDPPHGKKAQSIYGNVLGDNRKQYSPENENYEPKERNIRIVLDPSLWNEIYWIGIVLVGFCTIGAVYQIYSKCYCGIQTQYKLDDKI